MLRRSSMPLLAACTVFAWFAAACSNGSAAPDFLTADVRGIGGARTLGGGAMPPGVAAGPSSAGDTGGNTLQREIAEADVYAIAGDRLILLNAWRGLAVVDLEQIALLGRLAMHGLPHEVHLLGTRALVLVGNEGLARTVAETRLVEVDLAVATAPTIVRDVTMPGWFRTSRRVGDVLYVLTDQGAHSFATAPTPFVSVAAVAFANGNSFAHATDQLLFVAGSEFGGDTTVRLLDISSSTGAMAARGTLSLPGFVGDDQKLHFGGGNLRVVTHDWSSVTSHLFTVDVSDPDVPHVIGSLSLARGEQLFGTCFTDDRAYLVTFERIDPLWVVDLADPTRPRVAGELHVPGFSTQLVCSGNQLVSLGYESARGVPAVSLFDVAVPNQPTLLSRVTVGSVSPFALQERRALFVTADTVMVPTWDGLAVFDRGPASLSLRGQFAVRGGAMRGFEHTRGLVAVGHEAVAVADPSTLAVRGSVTIAENVVDVARLGDASLVELVQSQSSSFVRGVELPLAGEQLFVHGQRIAAVGWDAVGRVAYTIDFGIAPPRASAAIRIEIGGYAAPSPPRSDIAVPGGSIIAGYDSAALDLQLPDGLVLARGLPDRAGVDIGSGDVTDGFVVIDLAAGTVLPGIRVHGAAISGAVAEGNALALTIGAASGFDGQGRPLARNDLHRVDPRRGTVSRPVAVPGSLIAADGALVHTLEDTWQQDWTFQNHATALRIDGGVARRLDRRALSPFAYDFRVDAGTLYFTTSTSLAVPWLGNIALLPGIAIESLRLLETLAPGPRIDGDAYRRVLTVANGELLCARDAMTAEIWDLRGPAASLRAEAPVDGYPLRAVADSATPGRFLIAAGYAGSAIVP